MMKTLLSTSTLYGEINAELRAFSINDLEKHEEWSQQY